MLIVWSIVNGIRTKHNTITIHYIENHEFWLTLTLLCTPILWCTLTPQVIEPCVLSEGIFN